MLRRLSISNLVLIRDAAIDFDTGLNAITGETGAGKTILSNAIGLLLGARGDAALIGAAGEEAYVEAEFDSVADEALGPLAELRPEGEDGLVLARRIFPDGRTRAYAWGRAAAREDVAGAAEQLIAMSGQFEQRRLARPAYQRGVLDAFAELDVREAQRAWRDLQAAQRAHDELSRDTDAALARLEELRALAADTDGLEADREDELRAERERLRHVTELAQAAASAADALTPEEGAGASDLVAGAERAVAPLERLAPELAVAGDCFAPGRAAAPGDRFRPAWLPALARSRARTPGGGGGRARPAGRPAPPPPCADVRRAARARRRCARGARRARRRPRPGAGCRAGTGRGGRQRLPPARGAPAGAQGGG